MSAEVPTNLRVLNLFFDLLTAPRGRTKDQVRASAGYSTMSPSAFESAFQRDKDALREAGVVLEIDAGVDGERYRVGAGSFPRAEEELDATDLALIDLAVSAWSSVPPARTQMLRSKLAARSGDAPGAPLMPVALGLDGSQRVVDVLDAIRERRTVSFTYAAGSGTRERAVEPWRLVLRGSGLYLHGWDLDREAPRMYRLSRIRGDIETLGEPGDARAPVGDPGDPFDTLVVAPVLWARVGAAPHVRLHADAGADEGAPPAGWEVLRGQPDDTGEWISRVLADAQDAIVREPADLRRAVLARLAAAAAWTGGTAPAAGRRAHA